MKGVECFNTKGMKALKSLSLEVRSGEILGICGVDGNGQSELSDCITGLTKVTAGNVLVNGKEVTNAKPLEVLKRKVSHIPEDRHKRGVVLGMNLVENVLLMNYYREDFTKGEWLNWKYINQYAGDLLKQYQ